VSQEGGGESQAVSHDGKAYIGGNLSLSITIKTMLANVCPLDAKSMFSIKIYCYSTNQRELVWELFRLRFSKALK
jgi:hypothetical protein